MSKLKTACHSILYHMGLEVRRIQPQIDANIPSLSPFEIRRLQLLSASDTDVVIDVGANEGQFAQNLRRTGYTGRIISFEPVPDAYEKLRDHANRDEHWEAINSAVGDTDGSLQINVSQTSDCSSFLDMSDKHLTNYPNSVYVKKQSVPLLKLDSVYSNLINSSDRVYLKIDVQGYELAVLRGAEKMLSQVYMLEVEMCLTELYIGQGLISDITSYLYKNDYDLVAISEGGIEPETNYTLWTDGIFAKHNTIT